MPDTYVAFRGHFELATDESVELRALGSGWYAICVDSTFLLQGPTDLIQIIRNIRLRSCSLQLALRS